MIICSTTKNKQRQLNARQGRKLLPLSTTTMNAANGGGPTPSTKTARRLLIVNADDLGYSARRDEGIFEAFKEGCVTSASLLVNAYSSATAASTAVSLKLPLGLHLNLTEGKPVSLSPKPSLIDPETGLFLGKHGFREACGAGRVDEEEVRGEIIAQINEFRRLTGGKDPTHVDGHQHCHILREVAMVFACALKECRVPLRTRLPLEAPLFMATAGNAEFLRSVVHDALQARAVFDRVGLVYPDYFVGLTLSGRSSIERVWSSMMAVPWTSDSEQRIVCEWMVHPGLEEIKGNKGGFPPDHEPDRFAFAQDRTNEKAILCDSRLKAILVDSEQFTLASFDDIDVPKVVPGGNNITKTDTVKKKNLTCCIVTSATPLTGNQSTALRIRRHLTESNKEDDTWNCLIVDANEVGDDLGLIVKRYEVDVALGIHAYRAGRLLVNAGIPYVLVLGGTDMNEMVHDADKAKVMRAALERSFAVVAFGDNLANKARSLMGEDDSFIKVVILPQTVGLPPPVKTTTSGEKEDRGDSKPNKDDYFERLCESKRSMNPSSSFVRGGLVFLLPLGIRPVKDPLYLMDVFHQQPEIGLSHANLILIGPELDPDLGKLVRDQCRGSVWYLGPLLREELLRAMGICDVVLNTSVSEGMSNTILEAMSQRRALVMARDIEGNRALVSHGQTGLLFSSPEEFVQLVKTWVMDPVEGQLGCRRMVENAFNKVQAMVDGSKERDTYLDLLRAALLSGSATEPNKKHPRMF